MARRPETVLKRISKQSFDIAERIMSRKKLEYRGDEHITIMLTLFSQGHDIAAFCATVGMGRSTFFEWLKKYPIFEEAYDTAREKSRFFFEQQALHGMNDPSFNTVLWSMQMRNRFGYTEKRTVPIKGFEKAKTYTDQFNCVKKEVDKGNLTADEACKFASFVATGAQIEVQTDLKLRVDNLEKTSKEN